MLRRIPLAQSSYQPRSQGVSVERVRNLYLEANPTSTRAPAALLPTPGLRQWASVGTGPIRGMEALGGDLCVVSGSQVWWVDSLGASTLLGPVSGSGAVRMVNNGVHVGIASGAAPQAANASGILTIASWPAIAAAYQDGLGVFLRAGTQEFYSTAVDDMTTIGALSFSTADAQPDLLVGAVSDHRELWLFKERTIEVWVNAGLSGFPFVRAGGGFVEHGCKSGGSIAKAENMVFWLGDDLNVYRAAGYQAEAVSSAAIRNMIAGAASPDTCVAFTYTQAGHEWYVLLFSDLCLAYDITTGLWSERKSRSITRWRPNCYARFGDRHLVGDYSTGAIWELDLDTYTEGSEMLEREVVTPYAWAESQPLVYRAVRLDAEMGVGLVSGQGSDPVALLSWSDDGGRTWSDERAATLGKLGEYRAVAEWQMLGRSRARAFRIRVTDPVFAAFTGLYSSVEVHDR